MPLFDYKCPNDHIQELYFKTLEDKKEEVTCYKCKETAKLCLSAPPFHLKGKGWFKDET